MNCIIDHKSMALGRAPGEFRIDVDPKSRMFDPNSPDCPPMPPDDPISHQLMHCVDCKPGAPCWRHVGKTPYVDNPSWEDYLPRDKDGNVVLDLTGAVQVALLESPTYQQQLEDAVLIGAGRDVRAVPVRFAVFRRVVGLLHGGRAGAGGQGRRVEHVGSQSIAARQSVIALKS